MTPNIVKGTNSLPVDRTDDPNHPANNPAFHAAGYKNDNKSQDQSSTSMSSGGIDGDHSGKAMDQGANAATNVSDMTEGIHEDAKQTAGAGIKETGSGTSIFSKDGAIGGAFTKDGAIGGVGQAIGGPMAADGMIGKNFNPDGAVGGAFQRMAEKNEQH